MWWVGDDLLRPDVNFLGITAQAGGIDVWAVLGCRFTHWSSRLLKDCVQDPVDDARFRRVSPTMFPVSQ